MGVRALVIVRASGRFFHGGKIKDENSRRQVTEVGKSRKRWLFLEAIFCIVRKENAHISCLFACYLSFLMVGISLIGQISVQLIPEFSTFFMRRALTFDTIMLFQHGPYFHIYCRISIKISKRSKSLARIAKLRSSISLFLAE